MFEGKKILITGGTGSLGQALAKRLLSLNVDTVRIFSRNENKQVIMESEFNDNRLRFLIGDIRDYDRLTRALEDIDIVFHAAALKHVPVIEYNPFEAIKTNVIGTQNLIQACLYENVETVIGISTDKAVSPLNTYGATKLLLEKLFVTAGNYLDKKRHKTKFVTVRYGNVLGSSGSVVPKFIEMIRAKQKITITDSTMTRFSITMDEALDFILESAIKGKGSDILIPKLKSYKITDLKDALMEILGKTNEEKIEIRPGEKINEILINQDELRQTFEIDSGYVIIEPSISDEEIKTRYKEVKKFKTDVTYSSDNATKLTINELKEILIKSKLFDIS